MGAELTFAQRLVLASNPSTASLTIPAPIGGLNARDALAAMPETDAVVLENFFPDISSVNLRAGSAVWATGMTGTVESLMCYSAAASGGASSANRQLFAAVAGTGNFYNVTMSGAVGSPAVIGLQNAQWESAIMGTPGGQFMYACNAVDKPLIYTGANWGAVDGPTGATITSIINSGTTATVTTQQPHGLLTGDSITVSGATPAANNGTFSVAFVSSTVFTYTMLSSPGVNAAVVGSYVLNAQTISSITASGTTATLTTAGPHRLVTGNSVTVSGTTPTAYSVTANITVTGPTSFIYSTVTAPGGSATVVGSYVNAQQISGVPTTQLRNPVPFKNRLWFVQDGTMNAWYLPTQSIYGTANMWPLESVCDLGGTLIAIAAITFDSASNIDDYLGFLTSEGELVIYRGTDPAQAGAFNLVGVFRIGRPVGRRCWFDFGSDTIFVTSDGFMPFSKVLLSADSNPAQALSYKIIPLVNGDYNIYGGNFGWCGLLYPKGQKIIVNVPEVQDGTSHQWVMNTVNQSWTKYTGWNAACFCVMGDQLFFGSNGVVIQADTGVSDAQVSSTGNAQNGGFITAKVKGAFNYFGTPLNKIFSLVRPVFSVNGVINPAMVLNTNFNDAPPTTNSTFSGGSGGPWNISAWNTTPWGNSTAVQSQWQSTPGTGFCAAVYMVITSNSLQLSLQAFDYAYTIGGTV